MWYLFTLFSGLVSTYFDPEISEKEIEMYRWQIQYHTKGQRNWKKLYFQETSTSCLEAI
jgi:hypothetical protein